MPKSKTMFCASIEVRDYSETNKTVLNPENADKFVLKLGFFERPSAVEKIRRLLADNNPNFTFLLNLTECIDYESNPEAVV